MVFLRGILGMASFLLLSLGDFGLTHFGGFGLGFLGLCLRLRFGCLVGSLFGRLFDC